MKRLTMILIMMQFSLAQQTQVGVPYSQINSSGNNYQTVNLPHVDHDALLEEDMYRALGTPYRYGFIHEGNFSSENSGVWEKQPMVVYCGNSY